MYVRGGAFQTGDCNSQFYQRLLIFMMRQELYKYRLECRTQFASHQENASLLGYDTVSLQAVTVASHPRRLAHLATSLREPKISQTAELMHIRWLYSLQDSGIVISVPQLWFVSNSKH